MTYRLKWKSAKWWAIRAEVFIRDGFRCCHCGWVPASFTPSDDYDGRYAPYDFDKGLEIDHIVPASMGGANEINNFQTLCETCNRRKGAKYDGPQMALPVR